MGAFKLSLEASPPPANDLFAAAETLTGTDTTVSGQTIGATGENGEPNGTAGASVWYRWTAPTASRVKVAVTSEEGLSARVYTGSATTSLTSVASGSSFRATAGTTYSILVDGASDVRR